MTTIVNLPLLDQLTNGSTADATEVMADLNAIANDVNTNVPAAITAAVNAINIPVFNMQVFTTSGTFTVPANTTSTTKFKFTVTGDGGGGCSSGSGGSGGGAGGTSIYITSGLTVGQTCAITIGSGGAGGTGGGNGSAGTGSSAVVGGTTVTANPGAGGIAAGGASDGGTAANGTINISGGGGWADGNSVLAGGGGVSFWGGGGVYSTTSIARAYGAGGQGRAPIGISGGPGVVVVEWVL